MVNVSVKDQGGGIPPEVVGNQRYAFIRPDSNCLGPRFKFAKHAESTRNGKPVVVLKMSPSSFVIATFVNPIFVTMEKEGEHHVLQYDGRTTPKIKDGNKWKDLDAVTVFDWDGIGN